MFTDFLQRLFSSDCRRNNIEERQMKEILQQNNAESNFSIQSDGDTTDTTPSIQSPYSNDIQVLKDRFGLVSGQRIELSLKEALEIMPRKRQKSDAYKGLVSELRKAYGVELCISSCIKSHHNNNGLNENK